MNTLTSDAVTRQDALNHIKAVEAQERRTISDPKGYFRGQITEITSRLEREHQLNPGSAEMGEVRGHFATIEEYFTWLEGVLNFQKAYLAALD